MVEFWGPIFSRTRFKKETTPSLISLKLIQCTGFIYVNSFHLSLTHPCWQLCTTQLSPQQSIMSFENERSLLSWHSSERYSEGTEGSPSQTLEGIYCGRESPIHHYWSQVIKINGQKITQMISLFIVFSCSWGNPTQASWGYQTCESEFSEGFSESVLTAIKTRE